MKKWISFEYSIVVALLAALPVSAQQVAVPLGSSDAPYGFYRYLPDGYDSNSGEWPVVVFLHGLGQIGNGTTQLSRVLDLGVPQNINNGQDYPFVAISPQSPGEWNVTNIDAMIEFVKSNYRVDPDRIYLTGISLGGGGTWNYAKAHPEKLAAILPICGSATIPVGSRLVDLPTWAFHSWGDSQPSATAPYSVDWADAIAAALSNSTSDVMASYPGTFSGPPGPGQTSDQDRTASFDAGTGSWTWRSGVPDAAVIDDSHPNLTLYQDTSHDSWTRTYANQDAWDWLLAQERDPGFCDLGSQLIVPEEAGAAAGGSYFPLEYAFDAAPRASSACEPLGGGSGGNDAPAFSSRVGYIDFGADWADVRITSTWTRYLAWSVGDQTPYAELWWDDDNDSVNDSGLDETEINFNTAQDLDTGLSAPWLRDRDLNDSPVTPRGRYLLIQSPANMNSRAKEYAILGYIADEPDLELIVPTDKGTASGSIYFPMQDAFDGQPTLNSSDEPEGGTDINQAPYLAGRAGYIDFGPDWDKVRITSTWTRYRTWSLGNQTPYAEVWWDDDTDSTNDSGLDETSVNFNTAQGLNTGMTEPWVRDRDLIASPVAPQARYLLCRSPSNMTDRAEEYAIIGFIEP